MGREFVAKTTGQNLEILFLIWSCACTDCLKLNFEIPQTSCDEFRWPEEDWTYWFPALA
jgi:hypothetical protein